MRLRMNIIGILKRTACVIIGLCVGWILYILGLIFDPYGYDFSGLDGIVALAFQLVMAGIYSAIFVGLALAIGLTLRIPGLRTWWHNSAASHWYIHMVIIHLPPPPIIDKLKLRLSDEYDNRRSELFDWDKYIQEV